jgi:drug/metabolite transporter (DMT)-like permease
MTRGSNEAPAGAWALSGAFIACASIWGSTFLAIRIGNETVPPVWAAALRLAIAALVLLALGAALRQPLPRGRALAAAAGYGALIFGANFSLLYWAELEVSSGLAAVLYATVPLTTAVMTRAFGIESLTRNKVAGALIALAGVAVIFSGEGLGGGRAFPILALLLATWCACLGSLILKRGPHQSVIGANVVACAVGCAVCLAVSAIAREPRRLPEGGAGWFPILYLAIAGSVGAFVLYSWLIQRATLTRSSYVSVVVPIVAVLLGALVRGERLHLTSLVGSVGVLAGLLVGLRASAARVGPAGASRLTT